MGLKQFTDDEWDQLEEAIEDARSLWDGYLYRSWSPTHLDEKLLQLNQLRRRVDEVRNA